MKAIIKELNKLFDRSVIFFLALIVFYSFLPISVFAQYGEDPPPDLVPPPISSLTKEEKKQLNAETKMKKRTKLSLTLMEERIAKSEILADKEDFDETLQQLGKFRALLKNTLEFLLRNDGHSGYVKNFKRFEKTLRTFIPRLELIRREIPNKYGYHVALLIKTVDNARQKTIDTFYDDTVLPEVN